MIREKEVIKINNKEYTVVSTTALNKNIYAFIMNNENYNDFLFVKNFSNEIEIVDEKKTLGQLIKQFNFEINTSI